MERNHIEKIWYLPMYKLVLSASFWPWSSVARWILERIEELWSKAISTSRKRTSKLFEPTPRWASVDSMILGLTGGNFNLCIASSRSIFNSPSNLFIFTSADIFLSCRRLFISPHVFFTVSTLERNCERRSLSEFDNEVKPLLTNSTYSLFKVLLKRIQTGSMVLHIIHRSHDYRQIFLYISEHKIHSTIINLCEELSQWSWKIPIQIGIRYFKQIRSLWPYCDTLPLLPTKNLGQMVTRLWSSTVSSCSSPKKDKVLIKHS